MPRPRIFIPEPDHDSECTCFVLFGKPLANDLNYLSEFVLCSSIVLRHGWVPKWRCSCGSFSPAPRNLGRMIGRFGLGVVSDKSEEYRRNAMVCESMSHTTSSENIRASWLRLAESWLRMIPPDSPFANDAFDATIRSRGLRQTDSKRSH